MQAKNEHSTICFILMAVQQTTNERLFYHMFRYDEEKEQKAFRPFPQCIKESTLLIIRSVFRHGTAGMIIKRRIEILKAEQIFFL